MELHEGTHAKTTFNFARQVGRVYAKARVVLKVLRDVLMSFASHLYLGAGLEGKASVGSPESDRP